VAVELEHDQVVAELELVPVAAELERDPVEAELERDPVEAEREHVPVEAVLALGHPRVQLAVVLRTKSVTAAHRPDLVLLLAAEDLGAVVAVTTREPAATEAVIAWEAAASTEAADVAVAVAVVAEDGDKHSMRKNK
jgi:hypothetical protein